MDKVTFVFGELLIYPTKGYIEIFRPAGTEVNG